VILAQITSDLVGEIVTREFVENAIRDVIDRIGTVCADEDNGVIMVDFGFGRLVSENKSVLFEYYGGAGGGAPTAGGSVASRMPARRSMAAILHAPITHPQVTGQKRSGRTRRRRQD
jgi:hypothetical protein